MYEIETKKEKWWWIPVNIIFYFLIIGGIFYHHKPSSLQIILLSVYTCILIWGIARWFLRPTVKNNIEEIVRQNENEEKERRKKLGLKGRIIEDWIKFNNAYSISPEGWNKSKKSILAQICFIIGLLILPFCMIISLLKGVK